TGRPRPDLPEPAVLTSHGPARVIAVCNQKGGVGKTTSTINLGAALAAYGRRVLLVDVDPQGALAVGLGVQPHQLERTVYDVLVDRHTTVADVVLPTGVAGMDLLPANIDLSGAELHLSNEVAREQTLLRALEPVLPEYDVVLIDCQPSLGLLTVNALTASDGVLIPLECEYFALRGVALLTEIIDKVKTRLNPKLEIEGILATMFDARTVHGREVLARVVEAFGDRVFHTVINRTIKFPETTVAGQPITVYAPTSAGAEAYRDLAREVLARAAVAAAR
ncbi:MAG: Cobyrinic acid a,c-diamide synthase, partial [Frankiales bacterium]|nr:Cobyrinic acid a,c-diamide synthase [Frankiales bacterium]